VEDQRSAGRYWNNNDPDNLLSSYRDQYVLIGNRRSTFWFLVVLADDSSR